MNLLKTFRGNSVGELQYKKAKWLRSLVPAVIFIEKEDVYTLHLKDIKSIVTKERFEQTAYKMGE